MVTLSYILSLPAVILAPDPADTFSADSVFLARQVPEIRISALPEPLLVPPTEPLAQMPVIEPDPDTDYKLLIVPPDPAIDFKLRVIE